MAIFVWHPYVLIDRAFTALPLYYGGKVAYPHLKRIIDNNVLLILGVVSIVYIWQFSFPYTLVEMSAYMNGIYYPLYLLLTFLAFVPLLYISNKLQNWKWMAKYGTKTLSKLVLHSLMLYTCAQ